MNCSFFGNFCEFFEKPVGDSLVKFSIALSTEWYLSVNIKPLSSASQFAKGLRVVPNVGILTALQN